MIAFKDGEHGKESHSGWDRSHGFEWRLVWKDGADEPFVELAEVDCYSDATGYRVFGHCDDTADERCDGSWWDWADESLFDLVHQFVVEHLHEWFGDVAVTADLDWHGSFS